MKMTFEQYQKLKDNGLSDEQIAKAAQTRGVELPSESLLGGIAKQYVVAPAIRAANLAGTVVGGIASKLTGNDAYYNRAIDYTQKDKIINAGPLGQMNIEGMKTFGAGGGEQIGSQTLEAAASFAPYGRMASGISNVASKIPLLKWSSNAIGKVGSLATGGYAVDVASGLKTGEEDPYAPGVATAVSGVIPAAAPVVRMFGRVAKFTASQLTGLNPETVTTLITNPKGITQAQAEGLSRLNLASQVKTAFDGRLSQLTSTGKEYEAIRNAPGKFILPNNTIEGVLNKYGVKVDGGKVMVGPESTPLKPGDRRAIEDFISQYGDAKTYSSNALLNVRRALDNMASYEADKSGVSQAISKELRHIYDGYAKRFLPGLKELDAKFAPEKKIIKQLKKDFFTPEGELKDEAINKIANSVGKGKDKLLARLEELVPGITQKAQILKAIEDIGAANGQKVGTYMRANPLVVGGSFLANPVLGFLSIAASVPSIAVPIIKSVGMVRGWSSDAVTNLISKVLSGKTLTNSELVMFRSAMSDHVMKLSPGDQLVDDLSK